jgi:hypothetical protein
VCLPSFASFFFILYGLMKSVRPYIEISIRLCHRSRFNKPQGFNVCFLSLFPAFFCSAMDCIDQSPTVCSTLRFPSDCHRSRLILPLFSVCVCFLFVSFWFQRTDVRPYIEILIRLCHRSFLSYPKVFCVCVCLVCQLEFGTDGQSVRPYIEISIRLCHRSRLI